LSADGGNRSRAKQSRGEWMSKTLSGMSPEQARNLDVVKMVLRVWSA
jgi:hypothetical protein